MISCRVDRRGAPVVAGLLVEITDKDITAVPGYPAVTADADARDHHAEVKGVAAVATACADRLGGDAIRPIATGGDGTGGQHVHPRSVTAIATLAAYRADADGS